MVITRERKRRECSTISPRVHFYTVKTGFSNGNCRTELSTSLAKWWHWDSNWKLKQLQEKRYRDARLSWDQRAQICQLHVAWTFPRGQRKKSNTFLTMFKLIFVLILLFFSFPQNTTNPKVWCTRTFGEVELLVLVNQKAANQNFQQPESHQNVSSE